MSSWTPALEYQWKGSRKIKEIIPKAPETVWSWYVLIWVFRVESRRKSISDSDKESKLSPLMELKVLYPSLATFPSTITRMLYYSTEVDRICHKDFQETFYQYLSETFATTQAIGHIRCKLITFHLITPSGQENRVIKGDMNRDRYSCA
jgi:hypothetical protein